MGPFIRTSHAAPIHSLTVVAAVLLAPQFARAQDAVADAPPPLQLAVPEAPSLASWAPGARVAFETGIGAARSGEWGDASRAFDASLSVEAHAETLADLAVVHRAVGEYRAAADALDTWLALTRPDDPQRAAMEARVAELRVHVARIAITVDPPDARVTLDGERLAGTTVVTRDPGRHVIAAESGGRVREVRTVVVAAGTTAHVELRLQRRPDSLAWVFPLAAGGAITTALTIAGAFVLASHHSVPACGTLTVCTTEH